VRRSMSCHSDRVPSAWATGDRPPRRATVELCRPEDPRLQVETCYPETRTGGGLHSRSNWVWKLHSRPKSLACVSAKWRSPLRSCVPRHPRADEETRART
jgi:hypothetical protein